MIILFKYHESMQENSADFDSMESNQNSKDHTSHCLNHDAESSESEAETEEVKTFHRRLSTKREIKCNAPTKEGYLMKQTSFQRWRRRYFKIKGQKLYYAKNTKSEVFDEIDLSELKVAKCSWKHLNNCWQCVTPFRVLVLSADSRSEMEDWISALKSAAVNEFSEAMNQLHHMLEGQHFWYGINNAMPAFCNICRQNMAGVIYQGYGCEICKIKSHKKCTFKALNNCKWTTLSSVGSEIIEEDDGSLAMPHQWVEGNLSTGSHCAVCEKKCGSVKRLQDWRCLWCKSVVHTACRPSFAIKCPLGPCRVSIVPPISLTSIGTDDTWEAIRPQGCSPLLVFVNSKSGETQGARILKRLKQLLNPAQVFDLKNGGPVIGLRLFKCFNPFRILVCGGDGSVGWVLSEIDKLHMANQCQIGILPLGTGNDLARVLGWGSACDVDCHLPQLIQKYEQATTKMLDRWSVMTFVSHLAIVEEKLHSERPSMEVLNEVMQYEDSVTTHLSKLLQSNDHTIVIASAKVLCETVKSLIVKVGSEDGDHVPDDQDSISAKCLILNHKLDLLLDSLNQESLVSFPGLNLPPMAEPEDFVLEDSSDASTDFESIGKLSIEHKFAILEHRRKFRQRHFLEHEALMSRADSLKKAVRHIIEHAEKEIDEQNRRLYNLPEIKLDFADDEKKSQSLTSTTGSTSVSYSSPFLSSITTNFPLPPASLIPQCQSPPLIVPFSSHNSASLPSRCCLQIPVQPIHLRASSEMCVSPQTLSPLPDIRRGSNNNFEFPCTLPVPSEFADLKQRASICSTFDDVELQIQGSNDNLVDADDEPSLFEEKSITDIRDSLAASLNTSIDIEDIDDEAILVEETSPMEVGTTKEDTQSSPDKESGDSEDTDDTIREKKFLATEDSLKSHVTPIEEIEKDDVDIVMAPPERVVIGMEAGLSDSPQPNELLIEVDEITDEHSLPEERIVEGAESTSNEERAGSFLSVFSPATRRLSTGAALKLGGQTISLETPSSPREKNRSPERSGRCFAGSASRPARKHLPIINPLVSLPMWPNITSGGGMGGLVSKVLLANADALCAAASPLMDLDDSSLEGFAERCTMNNYFGIGIDAKISLDFHNKREEHPEKCRSRKKNFMWYGVLASKELFNKTYKNFDQRVQLECDGERIPLPALQGIVVLNIPSFMGGTNFWGGKKEDDCFVAPSFDDRILEVVAVFGSAQMAASRIINLQHHRIAQCSSIKITVLGEEGVPVQVDGEAWIQPPGIVRIDHKNRVPMLCRNRDLEVSLKGWEEKQRSLGRNIKLLTLLSDEEIHCLAAMARVATELIKNIRLAANTTLNLENQLNELAGNVQAKLDKVWRENRVIEGPNLRMLATELVSAIRSASNDLNEMLKENSLVTTASQEDNMRSCFSHVEAELKKAHEKDHLIHFEEEMVPPAPQDRKRSLSRGKIFKLKMKKGIILARGGMEAQVRDWGIDEVVSWLDKLDLSEHKEAFVSNDIRGAELLSLDRRDLKEIGVIKIGHIKRIQQAVKEIKDSK